ncbi:TIGR03086 family metal-binding protein [Paractinoplanes brasiliensis]|nr:TIGR03086 family metal-binding protein [Actinoplanes brasiliensis]
MTGTAPPEATVMAAAACFAVHTLDRLTAAGLTAATPCAGWDLRMLLAHLDDSLAALHDGIAAGAVGRQAPALELFAGDPGEQLLASVRRRAGELLVACRSEPAASGRVHVERLPMPMAMLAAVGAVELAVHGWDVACARGQAEPIPDGLAERLLPVLPSVVTDVTRGGLFAAPVPVPPGAPPGDRLVAALGRPPRWGIEND